MRPSSGAGPDGRRPTGGAFDLPTLNEGLAIDPALAGLIRHMRAIDDYRQVFDRLQALVEK